MRRAVAVCTLLAVAPCAHAGEGIVDRPEKLSYAPLSYTPPRAADHRITLPNGVVAYLVPDRSVPLVTVQVMMRVGPDVDPAGKEGLAETAMYLLGRGGTSTLTAEQFEDKVAFLGAQLETNLGGATLNLLAKDLPSGLALLADCLQHPRFQANRLALRKDQQIQQMKERNDNSASIEAREWSVLMRGDDHWTNRFSTQASISSITEADLRAFHARYVGSANFLLAVSGDFDRRQMVQTLTRTFGAWPLRAERPPHAPGPTVPAAHGWFMVNKDVNQARVSIGLRSIRRDDPDYFAALVMNDILGGGGFTARLVNRIRSDEGLAYQVGSALPDAPYYPEPWRIVMQSKVRSTAYAIDLALREVARIRDSLVTDDELGTTKNGFIEGFPARFASAPQIASALAMEEFTGRYATDPSYFATYRDKVRAVTAADVHRVARRLLDPSQFAVLVVGKTADVALGDGKHPASITALAGGQPVLLPLRDPLTMLPVAQP